MTDQPPPLEYRPPDEKPGALQFVVGVALGGLLGVVAFPAGILLAFATVGENGKSGGTFMVMALPAVALVGVGLLLAKSTKTRRFGLGFTIAAPLAILATAMACGAFR